MARKTFTLFTLAASVLLSISCTTWGMKDVNTLPQRLPDDTPVLSVVMSSGRVVQFSKSNPGRVREYTIVGTPVQSRQIEITVPFSSKKRADGTIYEIIDSKGKVYSVQQVLSRSDNQISVMAAEWEQVIIPLSEAQEIEVKKGDPFLTTLAVIGGLAGGLFLILAFTLGIG